MKALRLREGLPRIHVLRCSLASLVLAVLAVATLGAGGCAWTDGGDDEPMTEARALRAVKDAIDCAYPRTPYDTNPRPDAMVYAIDREAVSFSWVEGTELRKFMKLRWDDLLDVQVIPDRKFPVEERAAIVVAVQEGSRSAIELQEMGAQRLRRLFDRFEMTFPARPLAMAEAFRDGALWLSIHATGPDDRFTPQVGSPAERPGFGHSRSEGRPVEEPDTTSPAAPGQAPSRRVDQPQPRGSDR